MLFWRTNALAHEAAFKEIHIATKTRRRRDWAFGGVRPQVDCPRTPYLYCEVRAFGVEPSTTAKLKSHDIVKHPSSPTVWAHRRVSMSCTICIWSPGQGTRRKGQYVEHPALPVRKSSATAVCGVEREVELFVRAYTWISWTGCCRKAACDVLRLLGLLATKDPNSRFTQGNQHG